jgi:hypothetical protein
MGHMAVVNRAVVLSFLAVGLAYPVDLENDVYPIFRK